MSETPPSPGLDRLKSLPLYALPHHMISRLVHRVTRWRWRPWTNLLIRVFVRRFRVDLREAALQTPEDYPHFNAFFTRALRTGTRPLPRDDFHVASPVDGRISQIGHLSGDELLQAKGHRFDAARLLGEGRLAEPFRNGPFATLYLSPRDYHRVHMPMGGRLRSMRHIPGRLFSVAPHTVRTIPGLFARNERVVAVFDTAIGPMAVVMVGAICVASIETVWHGPVTPPSGRRPSSWDYAAEAPVLGRGDEMGRFNMGSTVILLFTRERVAWDPALTSGGPVRMGQALGRMQPRP